LGFAVSWRDTGNTGVLMERFRMLADAETVEAACKAEPAPKKRRWRPTAKPRLLMLEDLDRRSAVYRVISDEIRAIESDLGGGDRLSAAEHAIVHDATLAGAMAQDLAARWLRGEEIELASFATLANTRRRGLETVGIKRQPKDATPTLANYLAAHDAIAARAVPIQRAAAAEGVDAAADVVERTGLAGNGEGTP
jgi:hypothetical protein